MFELFVFLCSFSFVVFEFSFLIFLKKSRSDSVCHISFYKACTYCNHENVENKGDKTIIVFVGLLKEDMVK